MKKLTKLELEANQKTLEHIDRVRELLRICENILRDRGISHDKTKLDSPEVELFSEYTSKLADVTYGSDEYNEFLKELKPALEHHYANNRHHPEKHREGVNDMTLIDVLEMLCDWKASSEQHSDGNILKSIEHNTKRFGLDSQLTKILLNTVDMFEWS